MKRIYAIVIWVLVGMLLLAEPSIAASERGSREEKRDIFCCRVVTKGVRPGSWMTEGQASAIMQAMWRAKVDIKNYRWEDRREHHYATCWWWYAGIIKKNPKGARR